MLNSSMRAFLGRHQVVNLFANVLDDEQYQSQFSHTLRSNVDRTVSDLVKADEYFVAYQRTDEGEPKWTAYVLIKIEKSTVSQHRLAIAEARRRAEAPPPPQWTASVFNIDMAPPSMSMTPKSVSAVFTELRRQTKSPLQVRDQLGAH